MCSIFNHSYVTDRKTDTSVKAVIASGPRCCAISKLGHLKADVVCGIFPMTQLFPGKDSELELLLWALQMAQKQSVRGVNTQGMLRGKINSITWLEI